MTPIFTLDYAEYTVANKLASYFKKGEGYSILIPLNKQEKGFDLAILNKKTNKVVKIQVKSSKVYTAKKSDDEYQYGMLLNNFVGKYEKGDADFYIIYGLGPNNESKNILRGKKNCWKDIFLCYPEKDMNSFLENVKTKKGNNNRYFSYGFNDPKEIYITRGLVKEKISEKLFLENQVENIKKFLRGKMSEARGIEVNKERVKPRSLTVGYNNKTHP